jgi:hypothetical protein
MGWKKERGAIAKVVVFLVQGVMGWKKEIGAIVRVVVFLVLGFSILWLAKTTFRIQDNVVLVSLLLIPVLLYLIFSGKLQEFSAGGVSAKFNDAAQKSVFKDEVNVEPLDTHIVQKEGRSGLERYLAAQFSITDEYIVLTLILGNERQNSYYKNSGILDYLSILSRYPTFKFLVFLNRGDEVFAYLSVRKAMSILEAETSHGNESDLFAIAINEGQKNKLLYDYKLIRPTIFNTDTNLGALEKMTEKKMNSCIVTDEKHKLKGIVEREQILSKLILAMTK